MTFYKKPTPEGLLPAVFTPFDEEGKLNLKVIPSYAKYLKDNHVDGLLIAGTSGEGPSLSMAEKRELLDAWLKSAKPSGMKVAIQVGGMPLPEVLEMAKYAEQAGADMIITLPELYFKPKTVEDAVAYVKQVAEAAPSLPILYYDHPFFSGVKLNLPQLFKLATETIPTFKGAKCSFSAALQITSTNDLNEDQRLFIKSPLEVAPSALMGFNSSMAGGTGIFPKIVNEIQRAIADKDIDRAKELQSTLNKRMGVILAQGDHIAAQKAALEFVAGIKVGNARYPITALLPEAKQLIRQNLMDIGVMCL